MDSVIGAVGLLVALFMIVAAVSEQVLETFRDLLEQVGITALRRGTAVDEAVRLAAVQVPDDGRLGPQIEALRALGARFPRELAARREALDRLAAEAAAAAGSEATAAVVARMAEVGARLKAAATGAERRRVLVLRGLSLVVCLGLCKAVGFDAFRAVATAFPDLLGGRGYDLPPWFGTAATAVAASGGSAAWHDVLDRLRAAKGATASLSALVRK
jgi:hypothetical protein